MKVGVISFVLLANMTVQADEGNWVSEVLDTVEQHSLPQEVRPQPDKSTLRPDTLDLLDDRVRSMVNQKRNSAR